jgi:hypothetical protein
MIEKETNHNSAGRFAFFAARDAQFKSAINSCNFSDEQKVRAERVKLGLEMVYSADEVLITFTKKWIRVKVKNGIVRDKKTLKLLEKDYEDHGYVKISTTQGIIYRVI